MLTKNGVGPRVLLVPLGGQERLEEHKIAGGPSFFSLLSLVDLLPFSSISPRRLSVSACPTCSLSLSLSVVEEVDIPFISTSIVLCL